MSLDKTQIEYKNVQKKGCSIWVNDDLRFPFIFLFLKSKTANFALVCVIILGN